MVEELKGMVFFIWAAGFIVVFGYMVIICLIEWLGDIVLGESPLLDEDEN